jgi:hypothetical protein
MTALLKTCGEATRWYDLDRWGVLHDQTQINMMPMSGMQNS